MNSAVLSDFRQNGYAVLKNGIPSNLLAETHAFLADQIDGYLAPYKGATTKDYVAVGADINSRFATMDDKTRHLLSGHFDLPTRLNGRLYGVFSKLYDLQGLIGEMLGTQKLFMHMPPAARWIMPSNSKAAVPPHQDISYNKHMTNFVVCWVPFVDIDDECGGVIVYKGTGSLGEIPVEKDEFWLKGINADAYTSEHVKIKRGDILFLNPFVLHGSAANLSNRIRISCDYRFFGGNDSSTKSYLDMTTGKIFHKG